MAEHNHVPERILELRKVPMLRPLSTPALVEILPAFAIETCDRGTVLLRAAEPVSHVTWVLEGHARWGSGATASAGSAIGLLPALARSDAPDGAIAATQMKIARLATERWFELLEDSFDLVQTMLAALGGALARAGRRTLGSGPAGSVLPREIDFTERLVRLRMIPPFSRAPIRALARIAQRSEPRKWARGACLWERGSEAKSAFAILSGELRDGDATLGAGHLAGLVGALVGGRRDADAYASASLVGIEIDVEMLMDVIEDEDDLALELLRTSARELIAYAPPELQ